MVYAWRRGPAGRGGIHDALATPGARCNSGVHNLDPADRPEAWGEGAMNCAPTMTLARHPVLSFGGTSTHSFPSLLGRGRNGDGRLRSPLPLGEG